MAKKTDKKTVKNLPLSVKQLEHLISVSIRNNLDVVGGIADDGYRFMIILDCLAPEDCIPHDQVPESDEEEQDILDCHGVSELGFFLASLMGLRIDGKPTRAVETIIINNNNLEEFLKTLDSMCNYWDEMMEDEPVNVKGKNVVEGNGTIQ